MNRDFSVNVVCSFPPHNIEKVWLLPRDRFDPNTTYVCNGCDNMNGDAVCTKCCSDCEEKYGKENPDKKLIREIFEVPDKFL